ncbi:TMEM43 family protein [Roseibium sp. Sym1]|uniref:TMEM43 family protein n=1 Tax=Roseibium sp. Sym1 TaxID=3016006 RepID=UPI0022B2EC5A|nr:TMEM43 family protein [Roseibium sp. Sym1]
MAGLFRQTTSTSWSGRIVLALGGIAAGFLLVAVASVALVRNEGWAVRLEWTLNEGADAVISVDPPQVDPALDGRLVHISGPVKVLSPPVDPLFGKLELPVNTIGILRQVEMYQWKEESRRETRNKIGGDTRKVTVYSYTREWSSDPIDSKTFRKPDGHENPDFSITRKVSFSESAAIGGFRFKGYTLAGLGTAQKLLPDSVAAARVKQFLGDNDRVLNSAGTLYVGNNPATPAIGDLKITLVASVAGDASVVGLQNDGSLRVYKTAGGNEIFLTAAGRQTAAEMFENVKSANTAKTWMIRGCGTLAIFAGFTLMFSILGAIGKILPVLGDVFRFAIGLASLALTCVLAPAVIGISWIVYRPVLGAIILIAGLAFAAVLMFAGKTRASAARRSDDAKPPDQAVPTPHHHARPSPNIERHRS